MPRDKRTRDEKARDVIQAGGVLPHEQYPGVWWVQATNGSDLYRVQLGEGYVTCTCPHGMHKGGGDSSCYHVRAVRIVLEEGTR